MSRWRRLLPVLAVLGCSGLDEGDSGVVALQVEVPVPPDVEVGDTLQLHATALDANGDPVDVAISWQAQQRLHRVWQRLVEQRGKRSTIVAVAVARVLAGFCWALARTD